MKIIYCLCDASQSGGTERVVVLKANYLAEVLGYDVRIVTTGQKQKTPYYDISEKIECFDLDINYSELDKYTDLVKLKKQVQKRKLHHYRLRDYLLKEKADIVISTHSHEFTILPKIEDGSKKIGEIHFSKESNWIENKTNKQSLFSKLFSLLANKRKEYFVKKYDKFVVLTKADLENWKAYSNVCHLYNPLSFYPVSHSGLHVKRVLGVGRLSLEKRFHLLIQAWSKVSEDFPDWTLDIFGTGKEKESLEDLIRSYKLEKTVCVNPPVKNIQQEYLNSSIYVMSSRYEDLEWFW